MFWLTFNCPFFLVTRCEKFYTWERICPPLFYFQQCFRLRCLFVSPYHNHWFSFQSIWWPYSSTPCQEIWLVTCIISCTCIFSTVKEILLNNSSLKRFKITKIKDMIYRSELIRLSVYNQWGSTRSLHRHHP